MTPLAICRAGQVTRAAFFVAFAALAAGASAQDESRPTITALRVGFAGSFKVGFWTPISVTIHGGDRDLIGNITITVPDGDGVPSQVTTPDGRPIQIRAKQDTEALLYAKIGQVYAEVTVRMYENARVVVERTYQSASDPELGGALSAENELIVTLGPPIGVEVQTQSESDEVGQLQKTQIARLVDAAQLPTRWYGYEGVDALIITTSDPSVYRQLSSQSARIEALSQWIERGGKLLLSVGKQAEEVSALDCPLARFLPGKVESLLTLRQAGSLETYADTTDRIDAADVAAGRRFQLQSPKFINGHGKVEATEGDLPLVIRNAYGFGESVITAFDIDRPPISEWTAREALLNKLLRRVKPAATAETTGGRATTLGYSDLAGQLRSGLDQFRGVRLVPFAIVAVLIAAYILVIGPIDYWFVKRVLKRMELTWITFPLAVLAFSLGAYFLAAWLKGDQLRVNQFDVIDVDADRRLLRGTMWANVFSPQHDAYDLSVAPQLPQGFTASSQTGEMLVSWMGLSGSSLGGMSGGSTSAAFSQPYRFSSSLDQMLGVPIAVWSTKAFTSRWSANVETPVAFDLKTRPDSILLGAVTSNLSQPLTDVYLLYGPWAWPMGKIAPGGTIELNGRADPQRLDSYLKPHVDEADLRQTYDPTALNVDRIVQVMSFYDVAGGKSYVNLSNRYQSFVDMSNQLHVGRAILVARAPGRTQLMNGEQPLGSGDDQQWTVYRFVTDVVPASND